MRILATLFFLSWVVVLSQCSVPWQTPELPLLTIAVTGSPPVIATAQPPTAQLRIEILPRGSSVLVDGLRSGTTPASLELPSGEHVLRVEKDGYEPLERNIILAPGDSATITDELLPLASAVEPTPAPTSPSSTAPVLPDLTLASLKIDLETGGACTTSLASLGLAVVVHNSGQADAGPFVVEANGVRQMVEAGLSAGETIRLWFPSYEAAAENRVLLDADAQVQEADEDNNLRSERLPIPTPPPTCTPPPTSVPPATQSPPATPTTPPLTPTPVPSPAMAVTFREGEVHIPTYPYEAFLSEAWNETYNMPYLVLDRGAYDASNPVPAEATYHSLEVENEYLKLVFVPDLGGRLYEVIYKPTGHRETYRNPVLKPSPWGPPEQGWWLAAGGFEWSLPVEEHGYQWAVPWRITANQDDTSVTVTLRDTDAGVTDRLRATVAVRLEAGASAFTIRTTLENPTGSPLPVKYWIDAMLAPGGQNAPSADLRFVLPDAVSQVTVHSRGDDALPAAGQQMSWPIVDGGPTGSGQSVDLSRLGNWNSWLGFFEDPAPLVGSPGAARSFMAVYDWGYDEGMVRVFPADVAPGAKGFGFGWADPIPAENWTDDGSSYVELHGGLAATFDQAVTLPAGGQARWRETWYPVAGLGGLRFANETAALNLLVGEGQARLAVGVTRSVSGDTVLLLNGEEIWRQAVALSPGQPFQAAVPLADSVPQKGRLVLRLETADGSAAAEYGADFNLK